MPIVITSPTAIADGPKEVTAALVSVQAAGHEVRVISNNAEPAWFAGALGKGGVTFLRYPGRQKGAVVGEIVKVSKASAHDVIVLAANQTDLQMGKNGGAVVVAAGWSSDAKVRDLGIMVANVEEFREVIDLTARWNGDWWYRGDHARYSVVSLADLSRLGNASTAQQKFAAQLTRTVKNGGPRLTALLAITVLFLPLAGHDQVDHGGEDSSGGFSNSIPRGLGGLSIVLRGGPRGRTLDWDYWGQWLFVLVRDLLTPVVQQTLGSGTAS